MKVMTGVISTENVHIAVMLLLSSPECHDAAEISEGRASISCRVHYTISFELPVGPLYALGLSKEE